MEPPPYFASPTKCHYRCSLHTTPQSSPQPPSSLQKTPLLYIKANFSANKVKIVKSARFFILKIFLIGLFYRITCNSLIINICHKLYNECEWRLIVPDRSHIKDFKPINWFWTEEEYQKFKETHKYPMATHLPIFKFTPEEVRFILVDKSISSCVIIDKILNMKTFGGNKIKKDQRYELLTKVVFLDEIKDNY